MANIIDLKQRSRIVNEVNTNFFVEAGAGSGKTTMLVERMVAMVESGIEVKDIAAITFTKAAANEFYERFQKRLAQRSIDFDAEEKPGKLSPATDKTRERCLKALKDIDLCFLGTIDSFCHLIINEHPNECGLPSDMRVLTEDELASYFMDFYNRIKKGNINEDLRLMLERCEDLFSYNTKAFYTKLLSICYKVRDGIIHYEDNDEDKIRLIKNRADELFKFIAYFKKNDYLLFQADGTKEYRNAKSIILENDFENFDLENQLNELGTISKNIIYIRLEAIDSLLDKDPFLSRYFVFRKGRTSYYELDEASKNKFEELKIEIDNYRFNYLIKFVINSRSYLENELKANGILTFFDCLYYLRNALRDDIKKGGKLIKYIRKKHKYYLIDEFQDTNPIQAQIFFYLSSEELNEDWRKCKPEKGTLFIVGDPKQSIYRFNNADIPSFKRVKELFDGKNGEVISLNTNFRSSEFICDWFKEKFNEILKEENNDRAKFEDISAGKEFDDNFFTGVYTYSIPWTKDPNLNDGTQILKIIKTLLDNDNFKIPDKNGNPRKLSYKDFMIITRGKSELNEIYTALNNENIPCFVEGKIDLNDSPAMSDLIDIYAYVINPKDKNNLLYVLTSNYFNYQSDNLYEIMNSYLDIYNDEKTNEVIEKLRPLVRVANNLTPSALIEKIFNDLRIFERVDNINIDYIYYVIALLRDQEVQNLITNHESALKYLIDLRDSYDALERCASLIESSDKVHLANLHKVKGLEAPVVILKSKKTGRKAYTSRTEYKEVPETYLFGISNEYGTGYSFESHSFKQKKNEEIESMNAEIDRLLYVAATRAACALIIGLGTKDGIAIDNYWQPLVKEEKDFFKVFNDEKEFENKKEEIISAEELYKDGKSIINEDLHQASYSLLAPSKLDEENINNDEKEESVIPTFKKDPLLIGSLVHRLMEALLLSKGKADKNRLIMNIINEETIDEDNYYFNILNNVYDNILSGGYKQESNAPQDILDIILNAEQAFSEVPFHYFENNELWHGIIDLVYLKDNKWHIIDYKTDYEYKEHKPQLEAYIKAFKRLTGNDADANIYLIPIK